MFLENKDIDSLMKIKDVVMKDICAVADRNVVAPSEWDGLDKAVNIIHHIAETEKIVNGMEMEYDDRVSEKRYDIRMDSWDNPYGNDSSYARGRSATTGRYISRDSENEHMRMKLQDMMSTTNDPTERQALQRVIDRM